LGGAPLEADGTPVPTYYDPRYKCEMEILRFDSRHPNPKFSGLIERLREKMSNVQVVALAAALPAFEASRTLYDPRAWTARPARQAAMGR
jgi:hypothetical protein